MSFPTYQESYDHRQMLEDYPVGDTFLARYRAMSRDELFALQDGRFRRLMERGWQVPFYRRLWRAQGIEPGDIRGLEDIGRLPVYDKTDLMASIEAHPPLGDFHGMADSPDRPPAVFHTTSGTTGKPQVLLFGPKGREVGNLLVGRMYRWMGLAPDDVVHSVYGHGMINGGHYIREAVTKYTNSLFLSAGTGIETRSVAQVRLMADFGVTTHGWFRRLRPQAGTRLAEAEKLFDRIAILKMIIGHLGTEDRASHRRRLARCQRVSTGTGSAIPARSQVKGLERDGLYVWEDAQSFRTARRR